MHTAELLVPAASGFEFEIASWDLKKYVAN
jgi:hypothetical protein